MMTVRVRCEYEWEQAKVKEWRFGSGLVSEWVSTG
jgi:hypothetical protein